MRVARRVECHLRGKQSFAYCEFYSHYVLCAMALLHICVAHYYTLQSTLYSKSVMYTVQSYVVTVQYVLEVSTGPKFPARPAKLFFRPGPARNQCIIKFVLYNFFEILQQNQYNYIQLHSYFPLVQLLYCPSTTVMYNVQLYQ